MKEKAKTVFRWIMFVPTSFIVFMMVYWAGYEWTFIYVYVLWPNVSEIFEYFWRSFIRDIFAVAAGTFAACYVVPKGKVIVAGCFLAYRIIILALSITAYYIDPSIYPYPFDTFVSGIFSTIATIAVFVFFAFRKRSELIIEEKDDTPRPPYHSDKVIPLRRDESVETE